MVTVEGAGIGVARDMCGGRGIGRAWVVVGGGGLIEVLVVVVVLGSVSCSRICRGSGSGSEVP